MKRMRWVAVLVAIALAAVATAAPATAAKGKAKAPKLTGSITVSAAASLTEAFTKMGTDFQKLNKGTTVTFNFAASSTLAQQIQGGAPADVFASADGANMQKLVSGGQVTADPTDFASNVLTIVVKPGNPKNVKSLADLANVGVMSLCADRAVRQVRGAGVLPARCHDPAREDHAGRRREGDAGCGRHG